MKVNAITKAGILVIIALAVFAFSIPNSVNAAEVSENEGIEVVENNDNTSKREKKSKKDLTNFVKLSYDIIKKVN